MMLTLVLLVGAVSCSPVPSEPSIPAPVARHGTSPAGAAPVEATHEARHVTSGVIEEVAESTLSTTSSQLSGEDDPPIPTATTPPVLPESEPQETNSAVTEPHHTPQQHDTHSHLSHGSPLVSQPHESHHMHPHASSPLSQATPHQDSQSSLHASASHHLTFNPEVIQPDDSSSGLTQTHITQPEVIQPHVANPESTLSHEKGSQDSLPFKITEQDSEPGNGRSEEGPTERPISSQSSENHSPHDTSANRDTNESSQHVSDDGANVQNSKDTSEVSHTSLHHHHHEEVETVVEAEMHPWENREHRHFSSSIVKGDKQDTDTEGNPAEVGMQGARNVVVRENNGTMLLRGAARDAVPVDHSLKEMKDQNSDTKDGKVEYVDTEALSIDAEEDTTDKVIAEGPQQESGIQVSIAGERVQHHHMPEGNVGEPSNKSQTHDLSGNRGRKHTGEMEVLPSLVMDSSPPIDIVERSDEAEREVLDEAEREVLDEAEREVLDEAEREVLDEAEREVLDEAEREVLDEAASETVVKTAPQETSLTPPGVAAEEGQRRSRIYVKSSSEDQTHGDATGEDLKVQDQKESEVNPSGSKMLSGLESMSMTSPTPDAPQEGESEVSEEPPATVVPSEALELNENTTATETEGKVEGNEQSPVPAPSAAPPPTEDYTDNYSDPISSGILPDLVVTQEEIPSREHPLTDLPLLSTSDKEAGGSNFRTKGGTVYALPPQQEQVSAVAPDSLTPGCIVAIVFGVIVSVTLVLGIGGFVAWQRRPLNRPKVLGSDRGYAGSDSGGYIDDQVRVSYVNSQIDSPKGSPEDLISLDNDSFLNSLESMTIQNLWTDNIRHTKL